MCEEEEECVRRRRLLGNHQAYRLCSALPQPGAGNNRVSLMEACWAMFNATASH